MDSTQVAGWLLLGVFRFIKDGYGEETLTSLIASTSRSTQEICSEKIRVLGWYPYACYVELLSAMEQRLGRGDGSLCQRLGEAGGSLALEHMFKIYCKFGDPERLIRAGMKIWDRYYQNAGRLETVSWLPENTVWRVYDFPDMNRFNCRSLAGWLGGAMSKLASDGDDFVVEVPPKETKCVSDGHDYHEFFCKWRLKGQ